MLRRSALDLAGARGHMARPPQVRAEDSLLSVRQTENPSFGAADNGRDLCEATEKPAPGLSRRGISA
jgi:hypothetical protein